MKGLHKSGNVMTAQRLDESKTKDQGSGELSTNYE